MYHEGVTSPQEAVALREAFLAGETLESLCKRTGRSRNAIRGIVDDDWRERRSLHQAKHRAKRVAIERTIRGETFSVALADELARIPDALPSYGRLTNLRLARHALVAAHKKAVESFYEIRDRCSALSAELSALFPVLSDASKEKIKCNRAHRYSLYSLRIFCKTNPWHQLKTQAERQEWLDNKRELESAIEEKKAELKFAREDYTTLKTKVVELRGQIKRARAERVEAEGEVVLKRKALEEARSEIRALRGGDAW